MEDAVTALEGAIDVYAEEMDELSASADSDPERVNLVSEVLHRLCVARWTLLNEA